MQPLARRELPITSTGYSLIFQVDVLRAMFRVTQWNLAGVIHGTR